MDLFVSLSQQGKKPISMKLKQSFALLLSLAAMSFTAQAQSSAKATAGNIPIAISEKQSVNMSYKLSSNASENIKLEMNLPETVKSVNLKASIRDASGKEVLSMSSTALNGHFEKVLNTSALNPGIYVMELAGTGTNDVIRSFTIIKGPGGLLIESKN
jgi:hypothetical protein